MGVVGFEGQVLEAEVFEGADRGVEGQAGELAGRPGQLQSRLVEVIEVQVDVAEGVHKLSWAEVGGLGDHMGQQGIAGDVEGDPEEEVGAALLQLA